MARKIGRLIMSIIHQDPDLTRASGLVRLADFVPRSGAEYARNRNFDRTDQPTVSGLSPWLRFRLVSEAEVISAAWAHHGPMAEKFISEVLWRIYWKGFLELRPALWLDYREQVRSALAALAADPALRSRYESACDGRTGIDGFDHWARQLISGGYLHNHARMWFASIWIFTLRLPWALGADFFLRHLLDGDPASNTLSWRWVAGLHTAGKTYLATAENISTFTDGRFRPDGLSKSAKIPDGMPNPAPRPLVDSPEVVADKASFLLLHEDDMRPDWIAGSCVWKGKATLQSTTSRSPLDLGQGIAQQVSTALHKAAEAFPARDAEAAHVRDDKEGIQELIEKVRACGAQQVIAPYAPVGPVQEALKTVKSQLAAHSIPLVLCRRKIDSQLWPGATHGFFRFREFTGPIPSLLDRLGEKVSETVGAHG